MGICYCKAHEQEPPYYPDTSVVDRTVGIYQI